MNPCSQDVLQFFSLSCVAWSEKQQKVIQTAEKASMSSLWYWKKRNQQAVVRLSYPSWLTYWVPHFTSLSLTTTFFNSLTLKFDIHCSVHCAHPQWLLVLFVWVFTVVACSFFLNPLTLSCLSAWDTVLFSCLDFSSSTCCNYIANIKQREKLEVPTS